MQNSTQKGPAQAGNRTHNLLANNTNKGVFTTSTGDMFWQLVKTSRQHHVSQLAVT